MVKLTYLDLPSNVYPCSFVRTISFFFPLFKINPYLISCILGFGGNFSSDFFIGVVANKWFKSSLLVKSQSNPFFVVYCAK